jgi:hypothetical protein
MKRIFLTVAFCLVVFSWPVLGQGAQPSSDSGPTLANLEIALWPEFDRPEVLVIYRGLFAPETPLPVPVEIRIPASAGQPTAVAYVSEDGQRFNQNYATRAEGDQIVVSFELPTLGFQLEYYDALPADATGQREYTHTYAADYPLAALSLEYQVPPTAEGFTLDPPANSVVSEADGLTYHRVQAGPLAQGETQGRTFTYQKPDSALTFEAFVQAGTPVPGPPPAAGGGDNSTVLIFLVAFVALIGIGAGAFWLGRHAQPISETAPPPAKRHKRRGSGRRLEPQQPIPASGRDEALFCHQCGSQLRDDSDFCHKCGAAVRRT